jgi:hypothetical protein
MVVITGAEISSPRTFADFFRQCAVDVMQLARLLTNPDSLAAFRGLAPELTSLSLDGTRLAYGGVSFGTLTGVAPFVTDPAFGAGVFTGVGGNFVLYLNPYSPNNAGQTQAVAGGLGQPPINSVADQTGLRPEFNPALNLYAQAFEAGEPIVYARLAALEPPPGRAPKHILFMQAHNDEYVPEIASETLAQVLGLSFALDSLTTYLPAYTDLPTLTVPPGGLSGNAGGGTTTLVFQQYQGASHPFLLTQQGTRLYADDEVFPPFDATRQPMAITEPVVAAQAQYVEFIDSYYRTGVPVVIDPQ